MRSFPSGRPRTQTVRTIPYASATPAQTSANSTAWSLKKLPTISLLYPLTKSAPSDLGAGRFLSHGARPGVAGRAFTRLRPRQSDARARAAIASHSAPDARFVARRRTRWTTKPTVLTGEAPEVALRRAAAPPHARRPA